MSPESMSGVHIICLQHLALLNAQPWQPVLEVGLLLLSAARATIKSAIAFSSLNLCEHLLHVISDPNSPVQVLSSLHACMHASVSYTHLTLPTILLV